MKMALSCKLLALETRTSTKTNKVYTVGLFSQGVQTMNFIVENEILPQLKELEDYDFVVDYNPAYKNFKLLGLIQ